MALLAPVVTPALPPQGEGVSESLSSLLGGVITMPGEHPGLRTSKLHPPMTNAHAAPTREKCVPVLLPAHPTPSAPAHVQGGERVQLGLLCVALVLSGLFLLVARWFVAQLESSKEERTSPRQYLIKASETNSHGPQWGLGFHKGNSGYYSRY